MHGFLQGPLFPKLVKLSNLCPVDNTISFPNTCPLDSILYSGLSDR